MTLTGAPTRQDDARPLAPGATFVGSLDSHGGEQHQRQEQNDQHDHDWGWTSRPVRRSASTLRSL
jgi:hypothetical protein